MKASEIKFKDFLCQSKTDFIIPVYQSNYSWNKNQCREYIKDIESLITSQRDSHFLGTFIYTKNDNTQNQDDDIIEYIIIDGQQRITTTMLFLKAIYDITDDQNIKNEIKNEFLTINGIKQLKLRLIKTDNEIFEKLLNDCEIDKECLSKIYLNYKYMLEYLKKSSYEILSYYKTFKKLLIVYIELHKEVDNFQLIFESINTRGHTLTQGDLIRNYILMSKNHTEQTYLYNNYWSKIEKHLTHNNITLYITDYLTMKEHKITNQDDVYNSFKNYIIKNKIKTEELLSDLLHYSEIYSMISKEFKKYKKLNH